MDILTNIEKHRSKACGNAVITLLIPTWNNLPYFQLCIASIVKNSTLPLQIIAIVNEGKDDTLKWIKGIDYLCYVYSPQNLGICHGLNAARSLIATNYVVYANDDMYFLPKWDEALMDVVMNIKHKMFMLSATMMEPTDTGNPCVIVQDFGSDIGSFREKDLLEQYQQIEKPDWKGSTWPPMMVPVDLWDLVGGMSVEFSPGMYSDPDLSKKLYDAGVRYFRGVGNSRVYHFGSKSTKRKRMNTGRKTFLHKWGITANMFSKEILQSGQPFEELPQTTELSLSNRWLNTIKRMF